MTFACSPRPWAGVARDGVGRWKSQNRKNVYLSPYVEDLLNSKVIKSFVPEVRVRKCFSCFEIPMFYVYVMSILWKFRISVSWVPFQQLLEGLLYERVNDLRLSLSHLLNILITTASELKE